MTWYLWLIVGIVIEFVLGLLIAQALKRWISIREVPPKD